MNDLIWFWQYLGQYVILDNNLQHIIIAGVILLFGFLLRRFVSVKSSKFIYRFLKKQSGDIPVNEFVKLLKPPVQLFLSLLIVYIALSFLKYPHSWQLAPIEEFGLKMVIWRCYKVLIFFAILWIIFASIDFFALVLKNRAIESESKLQVQLVPYLKQLLKIIALMILFFAMLGVVFKVNVGAVIAGLGIGGLAVALAGKETLENLLASFVIFVDKPFISGDLVRVNQIMGNVDSVGFRTTRIRTLDNSIVTIPNKQLIDQPLENLSSRQFFRLRTELNISSHTPEQKLKAANEAILVMLKSHPFLREDPEVILDRIINSFMVVTVTCYIRIQPERPFPLIRDEINFKILQILDNHDIHLANPNAYVPLLDPHFQPAGLKIADEE